MLDTVMQGSETEQSVISSLDRIVINSHLFDLVVIIRGGGSQADLSWFDNYNIAYHITQFPIPVITGIGHDKDLSVTDMVACKSLKTPTAVADFIIDCIAETENHILDLGTEIKDLTLGILDKNRNRIDKSRNTLFPLTRIFISEVRKELSDKVIEIMNRGKEKTFKAGIAVANRESGVLSAARRSVANKENMIGGLGTRLFSITRELVKREGLRLTGFSETLNILNPENVLKRGFTITSLNGRIIKETKEVKEGDLIDTLFSKGHIRSRVTNKPETDQ
jgi:exodeoxyribonuclease VII large subunit